MAKPDGRPATAGADDNPRVSDARGIVLLLSAARSAARDSCGDGVCVDLIDECIAHLSAGYDLPAASEGETQRWAEGSVMALLRLLSYAQAEVCEILRDRRADTLLRECIEHLLQAHLPNGERAGESALRVTH